MMWFVAVVLLSVSLSQAQAIKENDANLEQIDVEEKLGDTIPLDLTFTDDRGEDITLGKYFNKGKPVVLILGYYTCPMLCNLVMNGLSDVLRDIPWRPGYEFQIVSVSIDPTETDLVASAKKENYIKSIGKPGISNGWDFLTGPAENSKKLADAVGFKYFYVEDRDQYAHPAVLVILSPDGKITRYLYGIEFVERDFKLAITEASEGKVGSTIDKLILYCYHYDAEEGSYTLFAENVMRLGGIATVILLAVFFFFLFLHERRKKHKIAARLQN
jgi:protein SCO1/2